MNAPKRGRFFALSSCCRRGVGLSSKNMIRWITSFLFIVALPLQAGVYKWQSEDGTIHYSDSPKPGAEELVLPKTAPASQQDQTKGDYTLFEIETPSNEQTLRGADGQVSVGLSINPALQEGHKIRYIVDGKALDEDLEQTHITLQNLSMGSHSLQAQVIDNSGNSVKATLSVRFHLRQAGL